MKSDLNLGCETSSPKGKQTEGSLDEMIRKSELKSFDPESPSPRRSLDRRSAQYKQKTLTAVKCFY